MPLSAREGSTQFENPPVGMHVGRCYAVIDLGTHAVYRPGSEEDPQFKRKVRISFELPEEKMTGRYNPDVKGKPFSVNLTATLSLHMKSRLRPLLEGWRSRAFTKEELQGFLIKNVLGKTALLNLVQNGEYVNIASISPLPKKTKCPAPVNEPVYFSLSPDEFDKKVFAGLHERTREKIMKSPEYKALTGEQADQDGGPDEDHGDPNGQAMSPADDDVPF